ALAVLLLVVFGIKAAIFPLFFWLPDSYPTAPSPVTAIFAGLLTKVGVYAIIRTQTLLFPDDTRPGALLLVLAGATMLVGVLGAIAQGDVKRILSFQIVSHIGYMVMGLGLFTLGGLAAAVLYTIHHIVAKTGLFLTGGLIEHAGGSSRLSRLGGMVRTAPLLAVLFLVPALSLVGIPPLSGFVAKFALIDAAAARSSYAVMGVALLVSLLTMYSLMKIWISVFWSPATEPLPRGVSAGSDEPLGGPLLMVLPTAVLAALTIAIGLAAGPLYDLSLRAAADLLDPSAYVAAVNG
ncbi:MAG: proton-conducting transporter membrane subunit, partial [Acidimicrobiales bacterium]